MACRPRNLSIKTDLTMKTVEIYTDGEDGFAASMIKNRPARRLCGNRRTWNASAVGMLG